MDSTKKFSEIAEIMEREVTRSEFIKYVGIALVGMLGITAFLKNLHHSVPSSTILGPKPVQASPSMTRKSGYGSNAYGR